MGNLNGYAWGIKVETKGAILLMLSIAASQKDGVVFFSHLDTERARVGHVKRIAYGLSKSYGKNKQALLSDLAQVLDDNDFEEVSIGLLQLLVNNSTKPNLHLFPDERRDENRDSRP